MTILETFSHNNKLTPIEKNIWEMLSNIKISSQEESSIKYLLTKRISLHIKEIVKKNNNNPWNNYTNSIQNNIKKTTGSLLKLFCNYNEEIRKLKNEKKIKRIHATNENKIKQRTDYYCKNKNDARLKIIDTIIKIISYGEKLIESPEILHHPNGHKNQINDLSARFPHFNYKVTTSKQIYYGHICWGNKPK